MQIQPMFDRVLVIPKKQKQTTKSGITFTLQEEGNFITGEVVKISDGKQEDGTKIDMLFCVGDIVIFEDYSTVKIRDEDCTYYILKQSDILAKVGDNLCQK